MRDATIASVWSGPSRSPARGQCRLPSGHRPSGGVSMWVGPPPSPPPAGGRPPSRPWAQGRWSRQRGGNGPGVGGPLPHAGGVRARRRPPRGEMPIEGGGQAAAAPSPCAALRHVWLHQMPTARPGPPPSPVSPWTHNLAAAGGQRGKHPGQYTPPPPSPHARTRPSRLLVRALAGGGLSFPALPRRPTTDWLPPHSRVQ